MSIKAHRRKKASFKAFSFATYKGWSVFVAKGAAVRLRPSRWNKMAKTGLELFYLCEQFATQLHSFCVK